MPCSPHRTRARSRVLVVVSLVAMGACSRSSQPPAMSEDLKQDLAKVGASSIELAGANGRRLDVMSPDEQSNVPTPRPRAPQVARAPIARHSPPMIAVTPRQASPRVAAAEVVAAPAPAPEPSPVEQPMPALGRPGQIPAPLPSTQREPAGGWKTEAEVFRNSRVPIMP
jgi:hypothetical protein